MTQTFQRGAMKQIVKTICEPDELVRELYYIKEVYRTINNKLN